MQSMNQYPLPQIGKTLRNRYKIVKLLGRGGSGDTYLAVDLDLPGLPHCVVKHFKPKSLNTDFVPIAKSLFAREAEVLYQLGNNHDQIPRLFAHFDENGDFYLVQEFIDGHDLTKEILPSRCLSEEAVFDLLRDILEVVVFVHEHNIIHRDIKPQNLMRRHWDNKIVLIDFGSIKKIGALGMNEQGQTNINVAIGTPGYMPNEQSKGKPQLSSDVYAVGMIGIQALTGLRADQIPKDPNTGEVIWRDKAQVSNALANVLDTMVRQRISQRYQSAAEALQALLAVRELPSTLQPVPIGTNIDFNSLLPYKKSVLLLGVSLGATTSLVVVVLFYIFLQTSTIVLNQPNQSKSFLEKIVEPIRNKLMLLMNCPIGDNTIGKLKKQ
jgi:eukaryotic-like serine/threonine-protein kinase